MPEDRRNTRGGALSSDFPRPSAPRRLRPFIQIAAALKRQAEQLGDTVRDMQIVAPQIGLFPVSEARAVMDMKEQAELVADGYWIVNGLAEVEATILAVLGEG